MASTLGRGKGPKRTRKVVCETETTCKVEPSCSMSALAAKVKSPNVTKTNKRLDGAAKQAKIAQTKRALKQAQIARLAKREGCYKELFPDTASKRKTTSMNPDNKVRRVNKNGRAAMVTNTAIKQTKIHRMIKAQTPEGTRVSKPAVAAYLANLNKFIAKLAAKCSELMTQNGRVNDVILLKAIKGTSLKVSDVLELSENAPNSNTSLTTSALVRVFKNQLQKNDSKLNPSLSKEASGTLTKACNAYINTTTGQTKLIMELNGNHTILEKHVLAASAC